MLPCKSWKLWVVWWPEPEGTTGGTETLKLVFPALLAYVVLYQGT